MRHSISIVMPVHNENSEFLVRAVNSVLDQSSANWELVIVDDGSDLHTKDILRELSMLDQRIRLISFLSGHGVSFARNEGIQNSKYDYIMFLDADDWLTETAVEKLSGGLSEAMLISFNFKVETKDGYLSALNHKFQSEIKATSKLSSENALKELFNGRLRHLVYGYVFPKDKLISNPFPDGIKYGEDYAIMYKIILDVDFVYTTPDVLYHHFDNSDSVMNSPKLVHAKNLLSISNEIRTFFSNTKYSEMKLVYSYIMPRVVNALGISVKSGHRLYLNDYIDLPLIAYFTLSFRDWIKLISIQTGLFKLRLCLKMYR
ncbi:glycosyltransferase family 2 protein [Weissella confusa]|uniref:glycosyltransferase family 2 protein n=1 Tax=Weissella confusa TaxID=1583 RepID=UPI002A75382A|nr:glycosyltransferase family 2 protein [Weissella confusa]MDY2513071.1 glycosyltransferase family 2 protein [Weissella confusa]